MNLHEYQAKDLLIKYGLKVPRGEVASEPDAAAEIFTRLNTPRAVVKAQIHSGGRGKAGGIKIADSADAVRQATTELINKTLITPQTGPRGKVVRKVLISESLEIEKELYLGIVLDRKRSTPVLMVSIEGGVEIEELARQSPEKILKFEIHPYLGLQPYQARELVYALGLNQFQGKCKVNLIKNGMATFLWFSRLFIDNDCSLAEINPLIISREYGLMALDAKINLDDRALYRHKELAGWRDIEEEDPLEYEASRYDLSYIGLEGNIGCMVNGAGLAMSTMDLIKLHGGEPANFLDVGGGATVEQVTQAFKLLVANKNIKSILVNIFGGIMRCDVIAEGVTKAAQEVGLNLPLVVRLEGTNVRLGKEILKNSGLNIIATNSMNEAAKKVVALAKQESV